VPVTVGLDPIAPALEVAVEEVLQRKSMTEMDG
jgi:hypothetical protein